VELAVRSGAFEPTTHAFGFGLCQSNAWSFELPVPDSDTLIVNRSGPGAAAHALARYAIPQAAIRHALNRDKLAFNTLRGDIWMPRAECFRLPNDTAVQRRGERERSDEATDPSVRCNGGLGKQRALRNPQRALFQPSGSASGHPAIRLRGMFPKRGRRMSICGPERRLGPPAV